MPAGLLCFPFLLPIGRRFRKKNMRVLIACEFSGVVRDAFSRQGHDAYSCDLLPSERDGKHIIGDFRSVIQESWDFIGFHFECRVMANSGVRWLKENPARWIELEEAAEIFRLTLTDPRPGYSENSIMHCHAKKLIGRRQDQTIQPWMFGEPRFKATCLWLRGVAPLVPTNVLPRPERGSDEWKNWSAVHRASPGPNRWKERSRTLPGVAKAMAEQWGLARDPKIKA
jgi:hypothetical protein